MRNSLISRLFRRCFFLPPVHPTPPPTAASNCVPLHTVYPYLTGLLLALIEIKYQGSSSNNLFKEHLVMMMLFLISKFVYVISLVTFPSNQTNDHHQSLADFKVVVCHVSGTIACELLLLVLVSPIQCFVINVSTLILVLAMFLCCNYLLKLLDHDTTHTSGPQQSDQTVDVETEITSTL